MNSVPKFPRNLHMNQDVSTVHMSDIDPVYNTLHDHEACADP